MAKGIPYGISDFSRLIDQNYYYVDKTHFIPQIEEIANYLFLIRPRRFGKSVFLTMMRAYYDISQKDRFEERFGNLWIGKHPTPLQGIYQVLYFDFSKANLGRGSLEDNFNNYCCIQLNDFFSTYREYYQGEKELEQIIASTEAATKLHWLEATARRLGHLLYLIIDEYDNFTNVILSEQGKNLFRDLTHASGFYREYFKQFKGMFERIFLMGVSPVTLDDLSSGYNIDWNISVDPHFNMMMGFSETDVREMFDYYQKEGMLKGDIDAMINEMKPWYDNYCFAKASLKTDPRMFNCDMTLYYLRHRVNFDASPEELVDKNIRTDYSKLKMLARLDHENVSGGDRMSTIEEIAAKGEILVNLHTSFPAEKIVETDNFRSLLYYYGLLTMCGTRGDRIVMCIPNNCVREQYFGFLREYYQQRKEVFLPHLKDLIDDMAFDGQWRPLFEYIALAYKENSAIRDAIEGEHNLQGFFKAYLALASYYLVQPELEMNYGYCDFFLLPDKSRYPDTAHSYILELKYLPRTATDKELEEQAEKKKKYLQAISDECNHLLTLSNRVILLTQIEKDELQLHKETVVLEPLIDDLIEKFRLKTHKPVEFSKAFHHCNSVYADAFCLREILSNLIDNAIKYSGETVKIDIVCEEESNYTKIKVHDNGLGISFKEQNKIFDKFERADAGKRSNAGGFGLGLNYVQRVMTAHNGKVSLESIENKFSEFTLFFPVRDN